MSESTVTRNDDASRYEIRVDGDVAGFAAFERQPGEIRFTHTEVDQAFQGQGLGGVLASESLKDAAASGDTIVPQCTYIARYLEKHDVPGAQVRWPDR